MTENTLHNDRPITEPTADRFGIDPFARALAQSIRKMAAPEGTVIALNGPWGSGKSSAVNLILHHLKDAVDAGEIAVVNFACWWFRGEDALALAFFRELYAAMEPPLGDRVKNVLPKLGAKLLRAGSVVGAGADLAGAAGVGSLAAGTMNWLAGMISDAGEPAEKLYKQLSEALQNQDKRFLIVIDDIDRLSPDEALLIFRLVKSVGRLPNVIYLLVFDRLLAEAIVAERFPSEGAHYLEKIIQAGFDLPEASSDQLSQQLLEQIQTVCGGVEDGEAAIHFMNVYYDVVAPLVRTPRDLNRLMNGLSVTWSAIGTEVNKADFVALEALRLLKPEIHARLRRNKSRLCGTGASARRSDAERAEYDRLLFGGSDVEDIGRNREALKRIFPRLESVWGNMHYGDESVRRWNRDRRACSDAHFDAYFRLAVGSDTLPVEKIATLVERSNDTAFIEEQFLQALEEKRPDGTTHVPLLMDQLNIHADKVPDANIGNLLGTLFRIADRLDVQSDHARGFSIGNNLLRIHWLLRRLTRERLDEATRSRVLVEAWQHASLGWAIDFAESAYSDHQPRQGRERDPNEPKLLTDAAANEMRHKALDRMRAAAQSGELIDHPKLAYLMFRWRELPDDDGAEVKAWASEQLLVDTSVVRFAKALTAYTWSQTVGDLVARRNIRASTDSLELVMDRDLFRTRVEGLAEADTLSPDDKEIVTTFLEAWRQREAS